VIFDTVFTGLMLLAGVALGWVLARRQAPQTGQGRVSTEQLGGLINELAGDDPDRALAALTQAAEMDHAMADLHLTLGNLFRKRGEVDRALRVHEALLARPELRPDLREQVRFELAQDYLKAGVIDRAEQLLGELASAGRFVAPALKLLQGLHEQARDWRQAIHAARRLESARGESQRKVIAHYLCELGDEARAAGDLDGARRLGEQALGEDPACVRANLLLGALHEKQGNPAAAIKCYRRVLDQDPRFLADVIEPLRRSCQASGRRAEFLEFLGDAKEMTQASSLPWVMETHLLREEGQDPMPHLAQSLEQRPSRAVLAQFLAEMENRPEVVAAGLGSAAGSLRKTVERLMAATPGYQCRQCGFQPRQLFWQCPACKQWATTAPVDDVWQLAQ
jgi:lipopolysaccharide assembly protein B